MKDTRESRTVTVMLPEGEEPVDIQVWMPGMEVIGHFQNQTDLGMAESLLWENCVHPEDREAWRESDAVFHSVVQALGELVATQTEGVATLESHEVVWEERRMPFQAPSRVQRAAYRQAVYQDRTAAGAKLMREAIKPADLTWLREQPRRYYAVLNAILATFPVASYSLKNG